MLSLSRSPEIKKNFPLETLSSFRIGGPADFYYDCRSIDDLPEVLEKAHQENIPYIVIGGGSNTVFSEKGFRGLVIKISANKLAIYDNLVTADAGVVLSALILKTLKAGFAGLENLFGIPGTLGGAIRGNAGANGTEIKNLLESITWFAPGVGATTAPTSEIDFSYRFSSFKTSNKTILKATLKLVHDPEEAEEALNKALEIQKTRNLKYPKHPNCGSFFKNPSPDKPAGYLIEKAGLKGLRVGNVQVSNEHANFLINLGGGTQKDLLALVAQIKAKVKEEFHIELEEEVQIIPERL